MYVYIIIEDRVNRYNAEFTEVVGVFAKYIDAAKALAAIVNNPTNKTGKEGEPIKVNSGLYLTSDDKHYDDNWAHVSFECGSQDYRIDKYEVK